MLVLVTLGVVWIVRSATVLDPEFDGATSPTPHTCMYWSQWRKTITADDAETSKTTTYTCSIAKESDEVLAISAFAQRLGKLS